MRIRSMLALITIVLAGAFTDAQAQDKKKGARDLITRDELMETFGQRTMMEAIYALRPRFLQGRQGVRSIGAQTGRGGATVVPIAVVLDGRVLGEVDVLRNIMVVNVEEARYYEPNKAGNEFGNVAQGGAIVLKTFKPKSGATLIVKDDTTSIGRLR